MRRILPIPLVFALAANGCAAVAFGPVSDPGAGQIIYPDFGRSGNFPAAMQCEDIEAEIRKTDSIRWSMQKDGIGALTAADNRLIELLKLKLARTCPATASANPEETDLEVLGHILELQVYLQNDQVSESTYVRERTRRLNNLFPEGEMSGVR